MTEEPFHQRSRNVFRQRMPGLASANPPEDLGSSIVFEGGRAVDIVAGGRRIYGGNASDIAAEQVRTYLERPLRIVMQDFNEAGLATPLCAKMIDRFLQVTWKAKFQMPKEKSTFLVIFGLGLGYHLEELIRSTGARWVILVEPFPAFIEYSHHVVDWAEVFRQVDERDGDLYIIDGREPQELANSVAGCMRRQGKPYIDGTWVYTHYPFWAFQPARELLLAEAANLFAQCGFFEDELKMSRNAVGNFTSHPFRLLNGVRRLQRPETAVIVGAGPSLNESIEKIKEIRDRVVLFSAGTALRPLLRNGILPDFHCEIENVPLVFDVLSEAQKHGDLSRIKLIATASVDPRVPPLFGDRFFFFREISSATSIFGPGFKPLYGAVPTCTNTALCAASYFGFTKFLLFGLDCGVKQGRTDHAEGTIYRDVWKQSPDIAERYPLEVPGNFGGVARTNWVYDSCRRMVEITAHNYRLSVINCSDGAFIPGTTPKVPDAVEIEDGSIDRQQLFADLEKSVASYEPGELLKAIDMPEVIDRNRALYRDLAAVLDRFDPETPDFVGVYDALVSFRRDVGDKYGYTDFICEGTVEAMPRIAMYIGSRIAEPELRLRLFAMFLDYVREAFAEMERVTSDLFEGVSKQIGSVSGLKKSVASVVENALP